MYRYIIALVLTFAPFAAQSQLTMLNELVVYGYEGLSFLQYTVQDGTVQRRTGGGGGLGYIYYITNRLSIATGVEVGAFGATAEVGELFGGKHSLYFSPERGTEGVLFNSTYLQYKEEQTVIYGHIPLMLQLFVPLPATSHRFYIAAGVKAGIALKSDYRVTFSKLTTSGYLPYADQTLNNSMENNYITRNNNSRRFDVDSKLLLKPNLAGAAELGIRWSLERGAALYTGVYADYSILNVQQQSKAPLVMSTDENGVFAYQSILEAQYDQQAAYLSPVEPTPVISSHYVDNVRLISVGVKLKLAFNIQAYDFQRRIICGCQQW
ncbi:hypothetical protein FACS189467_6620 [Bacteroidia bacterium]|nr:hypothetical protein FACS189467_6620 [Bacteroidia bacterium]